MQIACPHGFSGFVIQLDVMASVAAESEAQDRDDDHASGHERDDAIELKQIDRVVEEVFENERCMPFRVRID